MSAAPRWFTIGDVARLTDLSISTVRTDVRLGELQTVRRRPGAYHRVDLHEAERYVRAMGCSWPYDDEPTP